MSISESDLTDFDRWLREEFARNGPFTALVVLVAFQGANVVPLCSTYLNVIGCEIDWGEITVLFAASGADWHGASFFAAMAPEGGPLDNPSARLKLQQLVDRVEGDRLVLNEGSFFDKWGRRVMIEEMMP